MNKKTMHRAEKLIADINKKAADAKAKAEEAERSMQSASEAVQKAAETSDLTAYAKAMNEMGLARAVLDLIDQRKHGATKDEAKECREVISQINSEMQKEIRETEQKAAALVKELHSLGSGLEREIAEANAAIQDLANAAGDQSLRRTIAPADVELLSIKTNFERCRYRLGDSVRSLVYRDIPPIAGYRN